MPNQWTANPCTGVCPTCKGPNDTALKGRRQCRPCRNRERLEAKRRDPEKWKRQSAEEYQRNERNRRDRDLRRKYGITIEDYDRMLAEQNGLCAVCRVVDHGRGPGTRLNVDHCHTSGAVRGLLCAACNKGLGNFRDEPAIMTRAIAYLSAARLKELGFRLDGFDTESTAVESPALPSESSPSD